MILNLNKSFKFFFILSLFWILLEGVFRKWIFLSLAGPLFNVKYILFTITYLLFFINIRSIPKINKTYQFFILLYILWCFLSLLNNRLNNSLIVGIIGLTIHLSFIPLTHLVQYLFINFVTITKFIKILTFLSIPICILGIFQFYLPADHFINGFVNEEQLINKVYSFTRISSVFPFVKIYNNYLLFSINIVSAFIFIKLIEKSNTLIYNITLILLVINMFMTGSRLHIILMIINLLLIFTYIFFSYKKMQKLIVFVFVMSTITFITLYNTTNLLKDPVDASLWRFEKAESRHRNESTGFTDVKARMWDRIDIFKFSNEASWDGYGIGMTYQGANSFIKNKIPIYFEEEGERFVLELGIVGGIIILLMRFFILLYSILVLKFIRSTYSKILILSLILYLIPPVLALNFTIYDYLDNFIYWFSFGLIIAILKFEQLNQA